MTRVLAWHLVHESGTLGYGDGRKVAAGEAITHTGPVRLCELGLHASAKILDALKYAPGPIVCRVRLTGNVVRGNDKLAASSRETLWMVDARRVLIVWACECAWYALNRAGSPDPRSVAAIREVMRQQRSGMRDQAKLDAASDAAWAAASDAAWAAASDAARAAAWAAARAAASDAARDAASDAARAAASDAARAAAWAAARDAASDAARDAQSKRLRRLIGMERRGVLDAEIARLCEAWGVKEGGE